MRAYVETAVWYTQTSVPNELISVFGKNVGKNVKKCLQINNS
jgi:hypothetical protein